MTVQTPAELKARYLAAVLPQVPAHLFDLKADLARFVRYPADLVEPLAIRPEDKALLIELGLPESAAPFLAFDVADRWVLSAVEQEPSTAIIGSNGSGDWLALDLVAEGAVVEFNHDRNMERTVMNPSVSSLLACLCCFAEWHAGREIETLELALQGVDDVAAAPRGWWMQQAKLFC